MINKINIHQRLDIIIKYLFVKAYIEKTKYSFYKNLYRKHIKLGTGGIEDNKKSIDSFEKEFILLIESIKKNGFNKNFPIPKNYKGDILNGAHRLACCIYFNIKPTFIEDNSTKGFNWDFNWFKKNNFSENELLEILYGYSEIDNQHTIVSIWPNILKKINTKNIFADKYIIIGNLNISLKSKNSFNELIYDIYSYEGNIEPNIGSIEKANILNKSGNTIEIVLIKENPNIFLKNKKKVRESIIKYSGLKNKEKAIYYTFHSSDSIEEKEYLKEILLNSNNIELLRLRNFSENKAFIKRLNKLKKYIFNNKINISKICIVGSSPLEIFNLNKSSDIDFIKENPSNKGIIKIFKDIDYLDYQYSKETINYKIINNKNNYFYFRGFKFIDLKELKKIKLLGSRSKDLNQAKLINNFLNNKKNLKKNHINMLLTEIKFLKRKIIIICLNFIIYITKKIHVYKILSHLWRKYILKNLIYNSKNILIITHNYYPYPYSGGIVEQVKLLSDNFIKKGYKVDILTKRFNKEIIKNEIIGNANIYRYSNNLDFFKFLYKNSEKYDIIISRQYYKNSFFLGLYKLLNIIQSKTIICADSGGKNDEINTIKKQLNFLGLYKLYFYIISKNDYLNCLNIYNKEHLLNILGENIKHKLTNIYNGIDISLKNGNKKKTIKKLLYIGRFDEKKGIFETINAFKQIKNNKIELNIIGYGEKNTEKKIKNIIKNDNRIKFIGKKYGKEKDLIIKNNDLFIFPSYTEGQPMTLLEAAINNLVIITTKVGNTEEIFGKNVIYTKIGDINDLKNKIEYSIKNINEFKYSYKEILEKVNIKKTVDQFIKLK